MACQKKKITKLKGVWLDRWQARLELWSHDLWFVFSFSAHVHTWMGEKTEYKPQIVGTQLKPHLSSAKPHAFNV